MSKVEEYGYLDGKSNRAPLDEAHTHQVKSFRLPRTTIKLMQDLQLRYSEEVGAEIGYGRLIEIALYTIRNKSLRQILAMNNPDK